MRFTFLPVFAAALLLSATGASAQNSPAFDAFTGYVVEVYTAMDDIDAATEDGDKYAGCRAMSHLMYNARYAANALIDLMDETRSDGSLSAEDRAATLQTYDESWDEYDRLARNASNSLNDCDGVDY